MDLDSITIALRSFWTVWLALLFTGIIVYAMWPGNRGKFDRAAQIPLKEDGQEF
ncbi:MULTISPECIES: cbb3-type cytochrome oxidase subunit 3 [unclassified Azospirillum]|jgi:cytochrome c oxidase cbb3-type subunit 4|uniref:cbb3-type cytochrome oxidase subunit 3 n=1 Tax=unclassified Azospirillum TaxID=2630922 RepID=UPI000D6141A4|nr:cbb3-type cytochrome c oxidase subunit 3 [Azospirillum sp. TSO22-1]PWC44859.1 cytochrome oxidase [Azospirillum sp. TSO22-1]HYG88056.1 cbb3-type cytochrome c oxidase subunit 3 [Azospirillum sp.]